MMGLRAVTARDATDSWAGYLYQSVLGLVVTLEKILQLQESSQPINGHFVYEDVEDFSIYCKDANGAVTFSSTHQAKYKKGAVPSIYYPFISTLNQSQTTNNTTGMHYFLNISSNVTFPATPETTTNPLPDNYTSFVYQYRNGNKYLGGTECLTYLEQQISSYRQLTNLDVTPATLEKISSTLLAFIDAIIIQTKEQRRTNANFRREITFNELVTIVTNNDTTLTKDIISNTLRKRFLRAFMLSSETLDGQSAERMDALSRQISDFTQDEFLSFVKKIHIHKDLTNDVELVSSFSSPEDLQDVLFAVAKSISAPLEKSSVIFKKQQNAYRPSTLRFGRNQETAQQNLKLEYIPKIKKNMSEHDIEGYFETKKIIIDGQTVQDIWSYEITSSELEKRENKINEPELKTLISVEDAIGELNEDA